MDDPRPLRGATLMVDAELEAGEWLASELVGCAVPGHGSVRRVLDGPSCSLLELEDGMLVPFVSDAVRLVDPDGRRIEVDDALPGPLMEIDVLTLFPDWFGWFSDQRHVRNAEALGHRLSLRGPARHARR